MFLLDKLLTTPLLWIAKEINEAVQKEKAGESEVITQSLSELYMRLETGKMTDEEFEAEEKQLLDRLDAIELRNQTADAESDNEFDQSEVDADDTGRRTS
tara:strand:+ start:3390 stop:3689 length:300 start_codon:yes stop_codon:yes gene_type:complete